MNGPTLPAGERTHANKFSTKCEIQVNNCEITLSLCIHFKNRFSHRCSFVIYAGRFSAESRDIQILISVASIFVIASASQQLIELHQFLNFLAYALKCWTCSSDNRKIGRSCQETLDESGISAEERDLSYRECVRPNQIAYCRKETRRGKDFHAELLMFSINI